MKIFQKLSTGQTQYLSAIDDAIAYRALDRYSRKIKHSKKLIAKRWLSKLPKITNTALSILAGATIAILGSSLIDVGWFGMVETLREIKIILS